MNPFGPFIADPMITRIMAGWEEGPSSILMDPVRFMSAGFQY